MGWMTATVCNIHQNDNVPILGGFDDIRLDLTIMALIYFKCMLYHRTKGVDIKWVSPDNLEISIISSFLWQIQRESNASFVTHPQAKKKLETEELFYCLKNSFICTMIFARALP